jgi:2,5-diamino-6-(ribosylamino)-4(3H)-pyrimidinone 5'-phosphate reductase
MVHPHITVNVATSADGKIDSVLRRGATISSPTDKARVDALRATVDAILVGGHTLLAEDPKLTVRSAVLRAERLARGEPANPAKVGIVSEATLRLDGEFMTAGPARRLIYTTPLTTSEQLALLQAAGAETFIVGESRVDLSAALDSLSQLGFRRLLVEGGGTLLFELFRLKAVDELFFYLAPKIFGGASAPTLADGPGFLPEQTPRLRLISVQELDEAGGVLLHYTMEPQE